MPYMTMHSVRFFVILDICGSFVNSWSFWFDRYYSTLLFGSWLKSSCIVHFKQMYCTDGDYSVPHIVTLPRTALFFLKTWKINEKKSINVLNYYTFICINSFVVDIFMLTSKLLCICFPRVLSSDENSFDFDAEWRTSEGEAQGCKMAMWGLQ